MAPSKYNDKTGADQLVAEFGNQIKGKVILVTGVSPGGLGAHFVEAVTKGSPKLLILAARSVEKAEATATRVNNINPSVETRVLHLDLASFNSVRKAAEEVRGYSEPLHILVNNSGIMGVPYSKTEDGHESQFQTNHLGPFLFTNLLIDKLLASGVPRVVNVSSEGYRTGGIRYFDYNFHGGESYNPWMAYGASKTGSVLHASELARRLGSKGLVAVSLSPGVIYTNLATHGAMDVFGDLWSLYRTLGDPLGWAEPVVKQPNEGVATHVFAAFSPDVKDFNGGYIRCLEALPEPVAEMSPWAMGELEGNKSWALSEKLVGQTFDFKL